MDLFGKVTEKPTKLVESGYARSRWGNRWANRAAKSRVIKSSFTNTPHGTVAKKRNLGVGRRRT